MKVERRAEIRCASIYLVVLAGPLALMIFAPNFVVTGTIDAARATPGTQVQYVDVGLNIEASLDGFADGLRLRTKVEQSGVAEEKSGMGMQDPVIRQTMLEGMSILVQGKSVVLGSLDLPGTTRYQEIEVASEVVR